MEPIRKILLYRLGSLGDSLLALPAFYLVRQRYPTAEITFLSNVPVNAKAAPLLEIVHNTTLCNEVVEYPIRLRSPFRLWQLVRRLRAGRYGLLVHLTASRGMVNSIRDFLFFKLCGINRIIGVPLRIDDLQCRFLTGLGQFEWEAARLARRVEDSVEVDLGDDQYWDLQLSADEAKAAEALLESHGIRDGFICASVGSKTDAKDWMDVNWERLLVLLSIVSRDYDLVLIGSTGEHARTERLAQLWSGRVANLCGKVGVRVNAALLKRARVFIGHDSGPMHLAATVKTPSVGIFSAQGLPGQWAPRGNNNTIFYRQTPCFGCGLEQCLEYNKQCILSISPDEVARAVLKYL